MVKLKRVYKTDPYLPGGSISEDDVISGSKQLKRTTYMHTIQNDHLFFGHPKLVKCPNPLQHGFPKQFLVF